MPAPPILTCNERSSKKDSWDPYFYKNFLGFEPLLTLWQPRAPNYPDWLTIKDFNALRDFSCDPVFMQQLGLSFIEQAASSCYEQNVCYDRQIATRLRNWHDFFNNLSWLCWPRLKWALVKRAVQERTGAMRNNLQNMLAHLDECGMIFCSNQPETFHLIKNYQWQRLFTQADLQKYCLPVLIGHGLLEKLLNPFIGITAKVIFLQVGDDFFQQKSINQMRYIDKKIADYISSPQIIVNPKALCPFPFLGWPNWYPKQSNEFYANRNYFREKRLSPEIESIIIK